MSFLRTELENSPLYSFESAADDLSLSERCTEESDVMQFLRNWVVEPQPLLTHSVVRFRRERVRVPSSELRFIEAAEIPRNDYAARECAKSQEQSPVIELIVVVAINTPPPASGRHIGRIRVYEFFTGEGVAGKDLNGVSDSVLG